MPERSPRLSPTRQSVIAAVMGGVLLVSLALAYASSSSRPYRVVNAESESVWTTGDVGAARLPVPSAWERADFELPTLGLRDASIYADPEAPTRRFVIGRLAVDPADVDVNALLNEVYVRLLEDPAFPTQPRRGGSQTRSRTQRSVIQSYFMSAATSEAYLQHLLSLIAPAQTPSESVLVLFLYDESASLNWPAMRDNLVLLQTIQQQVEWLDGGAR